ncbi:FecR family protein [Pseudobacteriovorax antillogorgiicola]|uniref:FecR family protein n=1 Tax=Pseudobacteriovorax antillogorgiicola TaxID=1513793 RepID=A0A1Y6BEA0_9BACT|nr:FecR family protein [Pseudobacteriovorax antillogorgiicola]TCS56340.1 FecR family protein [Pseudobacteriovorax antillogorgiicola]SMF06851.1 FecR family protein [Pseudobacteriovorax antillogorgiicola]
MGPTLELSRFLGFICLLVTYVGGPALAKDKGVRPVVGVIKEVKGAPDVLRDPTPAVTTELKQRSKNQGFAIVLYKKKYWEAFPLKSGLKIYYGDVLSSGRTSKMVLELIDGFKIVMAKDTRVRLTPRFVEDQSGSGSTWLNLLGGKVRAYLLGNRKETRTGFRSRSMVLGVRGTDFVFSVKDKKSQLITIEGDVAARPVSEKEAETFESIAEAYVEKKENQDVISQKIEELKDTQVAEPVSVKRGQKVEVREPAEGGDSPDPAEKALEPFAVAPAESQDLETVKDITEDIQELKADQNDQSLDKLIEDRRLDEPSQDFLAQFKTFSFRIGLENISSDGEGYLIESGGVSLGVEYRPFKYGFASLSFTSGDYKVSINDNNNMEYLTESYDKLMLSIGARYVIWDSLSVGLALSYLGGHQFIFRDPQQKVILVDFDSTTLTRLQLAYNFWQDAEVFLSMGGSNRAARLESIESPQGGDSQHGSRKVDFETGFFRIGLGWAY